MTTSKFKAGDVVQLKRGVKHVCPEGRDDNPRAAIRTVLSDIPGGLHMARDLVGCRFWNEEDVELAGPPRAYIHLEKTNPSEAYRRFIDDVIEWAQGRPILNSIEHFEHPLNRMHVLRDTKTKKFYSRSSETNLVDDINQATTISMQVHAYTAQEVAQQTADGLNSVYEGEHFFEIVPVTLTAK